MINIKDYEAYKKARQATEQAQPDDMAIYRQIYEMGQTMAYMAVLDSQKKEEARYEQWKNNHAYNILHNKMPDDCFRASFRLSGTLAYYERFLAEMKKGQV